MPVLLTVVNGQYVDNRWTLTTEMPHKYANKTSQDSALRWHYTILCSIIHIIQSKLQNKYGGILHNPQISISKKIY
jgi:hypothetical protein